MKPKVVFITGCSSGIGEALCWAFHRQGYRVIATARQAASLESLAAAGMMTLPLDVADIEAVRQAVAAAISAEGQIDILVNNAGFGQFGPLMDIDEVQLQKQFYTNAIAPLTVIQQVAPEMKAHHSGLIVNIGSISGLVTTPFAGTYCASKAALHSLSEALRMELSPFGIQVVTVQPGAIASRFGQSAEERLKPVLKADSWYVGLAENIRERASLSQTEATPADEFAKQLVVQVMQPNPPAVVRLGKKSRWLPWLQQLLPNKVMAFILKRRFGLLTLK